MEKIEVKIWDAINGKFRSTNYKVDEISNTVKINGIVYSRKGDKLVGRIVAIKISDNKKHMMGVSFPIYA